MVFYIAIGYFSDLRFAPKHIRADEVVMTFLFVHDWSVTASNKIVPGGWSIACEAMFYAAFPILLYALKRLKGFRAMLVVMAAYMAGAMNYWGIRHFMTGDADLVRGFAFSFWVTQLPAFVSGCWLAFGPGYTSTSKTAARWMMAFAALLILVDTQLREKTDLLVAISLLSLFVWAAGRARPAFLESKALTFLGKISFSVYIIHFFVISLAQFSAAWLQNSLGAYIAFLVLFTIVMAVSIPLSTLTYYRIEKPFVRYGRTIFGRDQTLAAPSRAAG